MTKNQKIAIGIGALALGYWLYTKNKEKKSAETPANPSAPQNTGDSPKLEPRNCPEGQELIQPNCFKAPCPKICADIPKSEPHLRRDVIPAMLGGKPCPSGYAYSSGKCILMKQGFSYAQ